ncbi:MAG: RNA polymerase sigma factor [Planctomycetota bacterium]
MNRDLDARVKEALTRDDRGALALIWDGYAADLFALAAAATGSATDAEDVMQELFVTIARKRAAVAQATALGPYLAAMVRNLAASWHRKQSREKQVREAAWLTTAVDAGPAIGADAALAVEGMASLPDDQREVVALKVYRGMTFEAIGDLLGIPVNTAASRYRYALEKLRDFMERKAS